MLYSTLFASCLTFEPSTSTIDSSPDNPDQFFRYYVPASHSRKYRWARRFRLTVAAVAALAAMCDTVLSAAHTIKRRMLLDSFAEGLTSARVAESARAHSYRPGNWNWTVTEVVLVGTASVTVWLSNFACTSVLKICHAYF